jgi:cell division protein FtsB
MTRSLFIPLLFAPLFTLVLPVFAQEEQTQLPPIPTAQPIPTIPVQPLLRDPRLFSQERERITFELQKIQQLIGLIRPDDAQTLEALKAQQAELAKQLRDLTQQMQTGLQPVMPPDMPNGSEVPPVRDPYMPPSAPGVRPGMNQSGAETVPPYIPRTTPLPMQPDGYQNPMPTMPPGMSSPWNSQVPPQMPPYAPTPGGPIPSWADQDRAWDRSSWGPVSRLPQELTEVKQSVESLKKEVGDLKDTIKSLETQIQLLTRNILLSERAKENGNKKTDVEKTEP